MVATFPLIRPGFRGISLPEELLWAPRSDLGKFVKDCASLLPREMAHELIERCARVLVIESSLSIVVFRADGKVEDYGVVGRKVVTDVGVAFIVDAFQNIVEVETMKYHGLGTGSTAEAVTDTALVTELTTEYTGNVRATGTTIEGATANIYRTVATNTLDGTPGAALREHGIFSAAAAGVLLDRTVFGAITLSSGDGLQTTYDLTFAAGG